MADVFVSYSRKNEDSAIRLIRALEAHRIDVWWDRSLETNSKWPEVIQRELHSCRAVVVCWSTDASDSHWVREEANEALRLNKYIGCLIAPGLPAIGFTTYHSENLINWTGHADEINVLRLLSALGKKLGRKDLDSLYAAKEASLARDAEAARLAQQAEHVRFLAAEQQKIAAEAEKGRRRQLEAERGKRTARAWRGGIMGALGGWLVASVLLFTYLMVGRSIAFFAKLDGSIVDGIGLIGAIAIIVGCAYAGAKGAN